MINGKIEDAKSFFKIAIKKSPNNSQAYKYLGDLYEKNRDLVKALENWQIYATKDENSGTDVYHKIESALFDLGRYSEVEKFYQKLISLDKFNLEAIIKLANVLEEKGEINTALALVENISDENNKDIRIDLMKLKLSIPNATPIELGHQIDAIINKKSENRND
jgi:tetratricopeptide (TPR) repeat protein